MAKPKKQPLVRPKKVSGRNAQKGFILREEREGQIESWQAAADRAGAKNVSAWARETLDREALGSLERE